MNPEIRFDNVWNALEEDKVHAKNLKLRSFLLIKIAEQIETRQLKQQQAAELLQITQPRVSALLSGKINDFRLDSLVDMAHRLGLHVTLDVAA